MSGNPLLIGLLQSDLKLYAVNNASSLMTALPYGGWEEPALPQHQILVYTGCAST